MTDSRMNMTKQQWKQAGWFDSTDMGYEDAVKASEQNVSALAIVAQFLPASWTTPIGVMLSIFAVMRAFFAVYLGFRQASQGIIINILSRFVPQQKINANLVQKSIILAAILLVWGAIVLNVPVLSFTAIFSPIFGLVGSLIPAYLVYKVPALDKYKGLSLYLIIFTGILLCISPFLAFS